MAKFLELQLDSFYWSAVSAVLKQSQISAAAVRSGYPNRANSHSFIEGKNVELHKRYF